MTFSTRAFTYARRGPISNVLKLKKVDITPATSDVVLEIAAAPMHRTDAAIINGTALGKTRPLAASYGAIGGTEGVGKIISAGSSKAVKVGGLAWIAPINGCWSEKVAVSPDAVHSIDAAHADLAVFSSSLLTAAKLTHSIKKGDVVVQNGGSSLVSLAVSALATQKGATVFTAATAGSRFASAAARHKAYNSEVFEATPSGKRKMEAAIGSKHVALFLNGGSGKYFNDFSKLVGDNGSVVTYGAQSGRTLTFAAGPMIYKSLTMSSFYLPAALAALTFEERQQLLDTTLRSFADAKFSYPTVSAKGLDGFSQVWDSTFVKGGAKGVLKF